MYWHYFSYGQWLLRPISAEGNILGRVGFVFDSKCVVSFSAYVASAYVAASVDSVSFANKTDRHAAVDNWGRI